jgi:hypothetical protein
MITKSNELCSRCRQIPGKNGMTLEATIDDIHSNREKFSPSDSDLNAMIFSYLYAHKDVWHCYGCWQLILDRLPSYMKGPR